MATYAQNLKKRHHLRALNSEASQHVWRIFWKIGRFAATCDLERAAEDTQEMTPRLAIGGDSFKKNNKQLLMGSGGVGFHPKKIPSDVATKTAGQVLLAAPSRNCGCNVSKGLDDG